MVSGLPWWLSSKESACDAGDADLIPGWGRSPGEGNGNPLQFLPGESPGQGSLVGYSPWGHKESDTTKVIEHGHGDPRILEENGLLSGKPAEGHWERFLKFNFFSLLATL